MYYEICTLSCLMEKPMHGYELGKTLKRNFSACTRISNNTIYPILKKFQKSGYIMKREEQQEGKPDRFVYEITEAGKRSFIQTLNTITDTLAFDREEFFIRVSFFHLLTPDIRRKVLEGRLAFIQEAMLTTRTLQDGESLYGHRSAEGREFLLELYRLEMETIAKFQCRIDEPCLAPKEYFF
ncbi:PadR family transcriptional regulator [Lacrimispora indolis]|uniref:PadR family transcriptional regulator n=1 Tax=Lacrimispora indolis TaxID=69825 RepID=UPI00040B9BB1|nr:MULTISPECIES: PadR family transcriptional regulator [Lachnospiraceae]MBE7722515.1 PadR family transcriptional regulator [Lacrimispora celerecrescens]